jgi:excisionase family DNA binding protein
MPCHLMTTEEVSQRLRVTVDTVRRWVGEGRLRANRINPHGPLLFDPADVDAALTSAGQPRIYAVPQPQLES